MAGANQTGNYVHYKPCFILHFIFKLISFYYHFICNRKMKNNKFMCNGAPAALRYGELLIRITTQKQPKQKRSLLIICND